MPACASRSTSRASAATSARSALASPSAADRAARASASRPAPSLRASSAASSAGLRRPRAFGGSLACLRGALESLAPRRAAAAAAASRARRPRPRPGPAHRGCRPAAGCADWCRAESRAASSVASVRAVSRSDRMRGLRAASAASASGPHGRHGRGIWLDFPVQPRDHLAGIAVQTRLALQIARKLGDAAAASRSGPGRGPPDRPAHRAAGSAAAGSRRHRLFLAQRRQRILCRFARLPAPRAAASAWAASTSRSRSVPSAIRRASSASRQRR
jgi:hypothetical protein